MKLTIYGSVPSLKNSKQLFYNKQTGRSFITSSKLSKVWVEQALWQLKGKKPVTSYPVALRLVFYVKDNRGRDLDNMASSALDVLQEAGIIVGDDWQHVRPLTMDCGGVDANPRVEISWDA